MVALVLGIGPSDRLAAQLSFHVALGARYSSTLVHDSIAAPFDIRPAISPALLVIVRGELEANWSADASIDVTPSSLIRHEGGSAIDIGSMAVVALSIGMRREISSAFSARAGIGAIRYIAGEEAGGLFREGSGGLIPMGTVATTYTPKFGARRRLAFEARYDLHRFITPAMRTQGFRESRPVHRIALVARLGWAAGPAPSP
jgi:hypothetical protein